MIFLAGLILCFRRSRWDYIALAPVLASRLLLSTPQPADREGWELDGDWCYEISTESNAPPLRSNISLAVGFYPRLFHSRAALWFGLICP